MITFHRNSTQVIAFQVKIYLTLLQPCSAMTLQSLCGECSAARNSNAIMNVPLLIKQQFLS